MSKLTGANDQEKLTQLSSKNFKEQAIWFLNAFWETFAEKEAEKIWTYEHKLETLDPAKADGVAVDELNAHRFLEFFQETLTVREMRDSLRDTGAIQGTLKAMPLVHYLLFRYKADFHQLVNAPQGDNSKEIAKAQEMLDQVQAAFQEAQSKAEAAKQALKEAERDEAAANKREAEAKASEAEAKAREADAKAAEAEAVAKEQEAISREADSKQRETELQQAQQELEQALQELNKQEEEKRKKTEELTNKSNDESVSVVQRNKAKNELAQHLAQDSLPLSRAKITQQAAVKKAEKAALVAAEATKAASQAREAASASKQQAIAASQKASAARSAAEQDAAAASAARAAATESRVAAANAKDAAEAAAEETFAKVEQAEAYLIEVKNQPGCAYGSIWWMERELFEKKAYLPERKGGYRKK